MESTCESWGLVYLAGTIQLFTTCAIVFLYPPLEATLYVYTPHLSNSTLSGNGSEHITSVHLATPCLLASLMVTVFTSVTSQGVQQGQITDSTQYTQEALSETGPWEAMFWGTVGVTHAVLFAATVTPGDLFAFVLCTCLTVHALYGICAPSASGGGAYDHTRPISMNFGVVEYLAGIVIAFNQVPEKYPNRYPVLFLLGIIDYFLCVGHTWDRSPTMQTIANCRLCYCGTMALGLIAMYCAWHNPLLLVH